MIRLTLKQFKIPIFAANKLVTLIEHRILYFIDNITRYSIGYIQFIVCDCACLVTN